MDMTLEDQIEFALRDAGWDFDEAARIARLPMEHEAMVAKLRELKIDYAADPQLVEDIDTILSTEPTDTQPGES